MSVSPAACCPLISNGSSVTSPAAASPSWSASSVTSTSPKRRCRRRSSSLRRSGRSTGIPPNPGGWITTTARNRALDRLRRESSRDDRQAQAALLHARRRADRGGGRRARRPPPADLHVLPSGAGAERAGAAHAATARWPADRRRSPERSSCPSRRWRSASCGPRRRSATPNIPYRVPEAHELPDRLRPVLAVLYLIFNEGHTASSGRRWCGPTCARRRCAWRACSPS